jgi:hypothetical protein
MRGITRRNETTTSEHDRERDSDEEMTFIEFYDYATFVAVLATSTERYAH